MLVWCTTSSGNVEGSRPISFLCPPHCLCLPSLTPKQTVPACTTQADSSFLASTGLGHGAWGLGRAGVRGTRGQGRSDTSQSVSRWRWLVVVIPGVVYFLCMA